MRSDFQLHHVIGWTLLTTVALYGLYSYADGSAHFLNRNHQHLLPLHRQPATASATRASASASAAPASQPGTLRAAASRSSSGPRQQQKQRQPAKVSVHPLSVCGQTEPGDIMSSGLKESYSIWAQPKGKLGEQLAGEIRYLAGRYGPGAPTFPPHVTVLGDIERPREEVATLMKALAAQVKKYRVNFTDVTRGTFFYQCVFLSVAKDEGTLAGAAAARSVFGMTTPPYMPHLSLLYSDIDDAKKAEAVEHETARLYGESSGYDTLLVENGFEVGSFALWYTPTEDKSLQSWCLVEEFPLTGGSSSSS